MRIGSLFSGYGGLDLAAMQLFPGSSVAWHCEWDDAPARILEHHWPGVPNYRDVTIVDFHPDPRVTGSIEPVDILTGGYPCQPFSAAGKRKGTDDERHLWPYVREAIRYLRPRFTFLENVAGHRSMGFDRVLGDCAEDGLHVQWTSLRASDIGAPHHRERLFILVTDPDGAAVRQFPGESSAQETWPQSGDRPRDSRRERSDAIERNAAHSSSVGPARVDDSASGNAARPGRERFSGRGAGVSPAPDAESERQEGFERSCRISQEIANPDGGISAFSDPDSLGRHGGWAAPVTSEGAHGTADRFSTGIEWGTYAPAVRRWERLTRSAPHPTEINSNGRPRLNAAFAEWMMGLPAGHVTGVPGIRRADRLKAIGNGVCPPQAVAAGRLLLGAT